MTPTIDLARLKYLTRTALSKAKAKLKREQELDPFALIVFEDYVEESEIPGFIMNSPGGKRVLFDFIGRYCREHNALGVIIVTDGWTLEQSPEQKRRIAEDPAYREAFFKLSDEVGVPAVAAAGYGRLIEMILCQAQTRAFAYGLIQVYERIAADGLIPPTAQLVGDLPEHKIRFCGEPRVMSTEDGAAPSGRIFSLFEPEKEEAS